MCYNGTETKRTEYMMEDSNHGYMTFEELQRIKILKAISTRVMAYVERSLRKEGQCILEEDDVAVRYNDFSAKLRKAEFELYLHAQIVQKGWYNRFTNGFMVFGTPKKR